MTSTEVSPIPLRRLKTPIYSQIRRAEDIQVWGNREFSYLAQITIGGQSFQVIIDTGSPDLWIASSSCTSACVGATTYRTTNSLAYPDPPTRFSCHYISGKVEGQVAFETVSLGQFQIQSQVFALVHQLDGFSLTNSGYSGILGLSFAAPASIKPTHGHTLLNNLLNSVDEESRFIAFKLGKSGQPSSFTIGGHDPSIDLNQLHFSFVYPLKQEKGLYEYDYYKLPLFSLLLFSIPLPLSTSKVIGSQTPIAVLDTGTTLILGPKKDVDALYQAIRASSIPSVGAPPALHGEEGGVRMKEGMWQLQCKKAVEVTFVLGESGSFTLDPADVSWNKGFFDDSAQGNGEDGWCLGGIQGNDAVLSGDWILGDVFLRNVYSTYHAPVASFNYQARIGLTNLTDYGPALKVFREHRGEDLYNWTFREDRFSQWSRQSKEMSERAKVISVICGTILGFAAGAIAFCLVRLKLGVKQPSGHQRAVSGSGEQGNRGAWMRKRRSKLVSK